MSPILIGLATIGIAALVLLARKLYLQAKETLRG